MLTSGVGDLGTPGVVAPLSSRYTVPALKPLAVSTLPHERNGQPCRGGGRLGAQLAADGVQDAAAAAAACQRLGRNEPSGARGGSEWRRKFGPRVM